ncbi:UvrD-helicase domain-containing protein [bacterium]|nr:UvrD-helicase domain-containing protein [bacterium]
MNKPITFRPAQLRALDLNGGKLVVAGAGSGKTTVLAERYVRLLESGLRPGEIVAMTFTRKAASSLRSKVYANLLNREQEQAGNARFWRELRDEMQTAHISTIHSFCSSLLRAYPAEAGIDPEASVGPRATVIRQQTLRDHLQRLAYRRDDDLRALLAVFSAERQKNTEEVCNLLLQNPPLLRAIERAEQDLDAANAYLSSQAHQLRDLFSDDEDDNKPIHPDHRDFIATLIAARRVVAPLLPDAAEPRVALSFDDLEHLTYAFLADNSWAAKRLRRTVRALLVDEFQDTSTLQWQIIQELVRDEAGQVDANKLFLVGDEKQSIYSFRDANVTVVHQARTKLCGDGGAMELVPLVENFRTRPSLMRTLNPILARLLRNTDHADASFVAQPQELTPGRDEEGPGRLDTVFVLDEDADGPSRYIAGWIRRKASEKSESSPAGEGGDQSEPRNSAIPSTEEEIYAYHHIAILLKTRAILPSLELQLQLAGIPYSVHGGIGFFARQEVLDLINLVSAFADPRDELARVAVLRGPLFSLSDVAVAALFDTRLQPRNAWRRWLDGKEDDELLVAQLDAEDREALGRARLLWRELHATAGRMDPVAWVRLALDRSGAWGAYAVGRRSRQALANIGKFLDLLGEIVSDQGPGLRELAERLQTELDNAEQENASEADVAAGQGVHILTMHAAKGLEFPVVVLALPSTPPKKTPKLTRGNLLAEDGDYRPLTDPKLYNLAKGASADVSGTVHGVMYKLSAPAEEHAEHLRLLYVAATRARDRLLVVTRNGKKRNGDPEIPKKSASELWLKACGVDPDALLEHCVPNAAEATGEQSADELLKFPSDMRLRWVPALALPEHDDQEIPRELAPQPEFALDASDPQVKLHGPQQTVQLQVPLEKFAAWIANPNRQNLDELLRLGGADVETATLESDRVGSFDNAEPRSESVESSSIHPDLPRLSGTLFHRTVQRFGPGVAWDQAEPWVTATAAAMSPDVDLRAALIARARELVTAGSTHAWGNATAARREVPVLLRLGAVSLRGRIDLGWVEGDTALALDLKTNDIDATSVDETIERHGYQHQARLYAMALAASSGVNDAEGRLLFLPAGVEKSFGVTAEDRREYEARAAELVRIAKEFHTSAYTRESIQ